MSSFFIYLSTFFFFLQNELDARTYACFVDSSSLTSHSLLLPFLWERQHTLPVKLAQFCPPPPPLCETTYPLISLRWHGRTARLSCNFLFPGTVCRQYPPVAFRDVAHLSTLCWVRAVKVWGLHGAFSACGAPFFPPPKRLSHY